MSYIFHTCFYINLDRSIDRRTVFENNYKNCFKKLIRISAIDGNTLKDNRTKLSKNELGCLMSHFKAIKLAHELNLDDLLIMEDDLYIDYIHKWKYSINDIVSHAFPDTECIQLHCIWPWEVVKMLENKLLFCDWNDNKFSTGCYYINKKGIKKIVEIIDSTDEKDYNSSDIFIYKHLKTYTFTRPLFNHQTNNSLIHNNHLKIHYWSSELIKKYFKYIDNKKKFIGNIKKI